MSRVVKCGTCDEKSSEWWSDTGVYTVDTFGMGVIMCKVCFKKWLKEDDDGELELLDIDDRTEQ